MSDVKKQPQKRRPPVGQRRPTAEQRRQQSLRDRAKARQNVPKNFSDFKSAPVATTRIQKATKPSVKTLPNGDCVIVHKEYVADILAGTGTPSLFTVASYPINPGQSALFQWLSRIAINYESYMFEKLTFDYETEASTSLGGSLILTVDYDAADPSPTNKQQAMAYRGSVRSSPWTACSHISSKEDLKKSKTNFVRFAGQPANTDIKTYDIGNLFVMSQSVSTALATLGELYVCYTVRLMTPVYEVYSSLVGGAIDGGGTISAANPYGTLPTLQDAARGISADGASNFTILVPGKYYFTHQIVGTVITGDLLAAVSGCTVAGVFAIDVNAAGTNGASGYRVTVTQPNAVLNYSCTATTISASTVLIGARPNSTT
jgi:hypothetical protein